MYGKKERDEAVLKVAPLLLTVQSGKKERDEVLLKVAPQLLIVLSNNRKNREPGQFKGSTTTPHCTVQQYKEERARTVLKVILRLFTEMHGKKERDEAVLKVAPLLLTVLCGSKKRELRQFNATH